ncbi:hypothetical protein BaRGS_00031701 [Batillaria attramentaria]|uniref:B30.2/SPRY domain-containing protein n=1 Tax=Batillaria attramentaria TaxID=370345 RepID=A0ABD0JPP6_9CAEN
MGTSSSTARKGSNLEVIPQWVYTVKVPPEMMTDKFASCSDGMTQVGPNTVSRTRHGAFDTDGARWCRGFTSGKHTFEVVYPMNQRGTVAAVGVGVEEAPLHVKGRVALVGNNKFSWGICLRSRRAFHKGAIVKKFPATQVYLPDKFYMYLDADAGLIQFGSDLDYYGTAISGIPRNQPLYPMVSATIQGATITMVYRGQGSFDGPPPGQQIIVITPNQPAVIQHAQVPLGPQGGEAAPPPLYQEKPPTAPAEGAGTSADEAPAQEKQ